jgi:hypothetical protein
MRHDMEQVVSSRGKDPTLKKVLEIPFPNEKVLCNENINHLEQQIDSLRQKLQLAVSELKNGARERALYLEMSNSLQASIRKPVVKNAAVQVVDSLIDTARKRMSFQIPSQPHLKTVSKKEAVKPPIKPTMETDQTRPSLKKTRVRNYNDRG